MRLQEIVDGHTEPWSLEVSAVEVKDVDLPEAMKRSMARQAEAERERRAKVINAEGEYQAAAIMAPYPMAMQMRYLQARADVASDENSTIVFPLPLELVRPLLNPAPAPPDADARAEARPPTAPSDERPDGAARGERHCEFTGRPASREQLALAFTLLHGPLLFLAAATAGGYDESARAAIRRSWTPPSETEREAGEPLGRAACLGETAMILPSETFSVFTRDPLPVVVQRLSEQVSQVDVTPFYGTVSDSGFSIIRLPSAWYRNTWMPVIRGRFIARPDGTEISVTMEINRFGLVIAAVAFIFLLGVFAHTLALALTGNGPWWAALSVVGFMVFLVLLILASFTMELPERRAEITRALQGTGARAV